MSPTYDYTHCQQQDNENCRKGGHFEWEQPAVDVPLTCCPYCGKEVERIISTSFIKTRKFNCELRDMGFTKLVRVDDGIFENVTRRPGEQKFVDRRRPETFPDLRKTVED